MKLHREWLMGDLASLQTHRAAIKNLSEELKSLELEFTALKATAYDKMPGGSGDNSNLEKIELNLAKREEIILCLNATRSHVAYMENLLGQLDPNDKDLIEKTVVLHSMTHEKMAEKLGVDPRTISNRKREVINKLLTLRFGSGYNP